MSVEEDTELRDLVSKTLENNGVLAKIRAELRASVFLALDQQESQTVPFENKSLKEYFKSPQAALGLCIVREFLEYLELDFTLSVYNSETSHGKGYEYSGRNKLIKDLQIKSLNGKKGPLLSHILQIAQAKDGITCDLKEGTSHSSLANKKPSLENSFHNVHHDTSLDGSNVPLDRTFTSDGSTVKGLLALSVDDHKDRSSSNDLNELVSPSSSQEKHDSIQLDSAVVIDEGVKSHTNSIADENGLPKDTSSKQSSNVSSSDSSRKHNPDGGSIQNKSLKGDVKNSMASLNDLPPINSIPGRSKFNSASGISFEGLGLQEDYEEDSFSAGSIAAEEKNSRSNNVSHRSNSKLGTQLKENHPAAKSFKGELEKENSDKMTNSPVGSISEEIDDDTNSGIDDLLNSTASTENTVDTTISHIKNNLGDYLEEV